MIPGSPTESSLPHAESLRDTGLAYAARGWWVFPCLPGSKAPATPHGFKDARLYPNQIRQWWTDNPSYNLGIDCGRSRLAIIDCDPRNGGADSLAALEREHGPLPHTVTSLTGAGGQHYFYRAPEGVKLPSKLAMGVDLKAEGGYIIVPPSIHPNGQPYCWDVGAHPDDTPLADLPQWILDLAQKPAQRQAAPVPDRISDGDRHNTLVSWAGSMRRRGMSVVAIAAALLEENAARCDPPLPEAEVHDIAASFARYEPAPPSRGTAIRWRRGHPILPTVEVPL